MTLPAFATAPDLATFLGRSFTFDDEQRATMLLELVSATVRAEAGQQITAGESTVRLPGVFGPVLDLPEMPVVDVSAVTVDGLPLAGTAWRTISRGIARTGTVEETAGQGSTGLTAAHWGGPTVTIEVTYEHGVDQVPEWLRAVCLSAAGRMFVNPDRVRQETLGSYNVSYGYDAERVLSGGEMMLVRRRLRRRTGTF